MTIWSQNLTRFTSVLVALGLLLGLTVTGCSDNDRNDRPVSEFGKISYQFIQTTGVAPKATTEATRVVLSAFNAAGNAVMVEQATQNIAEHQDITPAELVGSKIYAGSAQVKLDAVKLVLSYYNAEGVEVATADVLENVTIKDGAVIDFSAETAVTWEPDDLDQPMIIGDVITVVAKDNAGNALNVELSSQGEEVTTSGAAMTAVSVTAADAPVAVIAKALDNNGNEVDTRTYKVTVTSGVTWSIKESEVVVFFDMAQYITATDKNGEELTVTMTSDSPAIVYINNFFGVAEEPAEDFTAKVVFTATNSQNEEVDKKTVIVNAFHNEDGTVTWNPDPSAPNPELHAEESLTITASNASGDVPTEVLPYPFIPENIAIEGNTITVLSVPQPGEFTAYAVAKDSNGKPFTFFEYGIGIVE